LPGQRVLLFVLYSARVVQSTRESFLAIARASRRRDACTYAQPAFVTSISRKTSTRWQSISETKAGKI